MRVMSISAGLFSFLLCALASAAEPPLKTPGEKKRNNLVTELLHATAIATPRAEFTFTRATEGWVFIATSFKGTGTSRITLDPASRREAIIIHEAKDGETVETMRHLAKGEHRLRVECTGA